MSHHADAVQTWLAGVSPERPSPSLTRLSIAAPPAHTPTAQASEALNRPLPRVYINRPFEVLVDGEEEEEEEEEEDEFEVVFGPDDFDGDMSDYGEEQDQEGDEEKDETETKMESQG